MVCLGHSNDGVGKIQGDETIMVTKMSESISLNHRCGWFPTLKSRASHVMVEMTWRDHLGLRFISLHVSCASWSLNKFWSWRLNNKANVLLLISINQNDEHFIMLFLKGELSLWISVIKYSRYNSKVYRSGQNKNLILTTF